MWNVKKRVRSDTKHTQLVGLLKTTKKKSTRTGKSEVGQGAKMTKEGMVGVIGTHDDNDPNVCMCECESMCIRTVFRK